MVLAAWAAAAVVAVAPGFREAPALASAASFVAGRPVTVWCGATRVGATYVAGYTPAPGSSVVYLAESRVCQPLLRKLAGDLSPSYEFGPALQTLVHEAIHATGEAKESVAECESLKRTAEVGIRFFGLRGQRRYLRDMMSATLRNHRVLPAAYVSDC